MLSILEDGVVDHIVGDGVMAMWVPGFVGLKTTQDVH